MFLFHLVAGAVANRAVESEMQEQGLNGEGGLELDGRDVRQIVEEYAKNELAEATDQLKDQLKDQAKGVMVALAEQGFQAAAPSAIPSWVLNLFKHGAKQALKKILLIVKEAISYSMIYVLVIFSNYAVDLAMVRMCVCVFFFLILLLFPCALYLYRSPSILQPV